MLDQRLIIWYSLLATIILIMTIPLWNAQILPESNISRLNDLVTSFDDPKMTVDDLAFYLETHSFKATPMGTYVELSLPSTVCQLFPNGENLGLCDITCHTVQSS